MTDISSLLQQGNAWLFIPSAVLLGALHGLEPGHSKTMMAAFIVAIRGSMTQAVLLGLSATLSHTLVVWLVAMAGLYFGHNWSAETTEPYLQLASALLIIGVALWMIWRTWHNQQHTHAHEHEHPHQHAHDHHHAHHHQSHDKHSPQQNHLSGAMPADYQDAHAQAHANEIRRRFAGREVTTGQIILFGLTGGLIPCPASITVLLLCLQLKKVALGATLVLCFSIGLALTMVASGALAALSVKHVSRRWSGFGTFADKAPYFSGGLIVLVGLYVGYQGLSALL
jgi:nickel/cobalt exporter